MNTLSTFVFISITLLIIALAIIENFSRRTMNRLVLDLVAIIVGLSIGALLSAPLSQLPGLYGEVLPLIVSVVTVFATVILAKNISPQIDKWVEMIKKMTKIQPIHLPLRHDENLAEAVVDTSVLIDQRIVAIAKAGFMAQKIIIPKFILLELQNIADSKDGDRRDKGRRGLEALEELKKIKKGEIEIVNEDFPELVAVDDKLVSLCNKRQASLLTTDFNLNKVASLQSVRVLNINDLAKGLRPDLLPGEKFEVKIIHVGKDKTQGVGYLEDGTMIVVEKGASHIEKKILVEISRSLQTSAGKMFFARIVNA
jgi:uncharacterized protein YacL